MKSPYVSELQPDQVVTIIALVQHKDIRQKKTGEPYLSLILGDRTGDIEARMWDNAAEVIDTFERDDFLKVRGLLQVHQGRLQLIVHKLLKQPVESVDQTDFFPASLRDPEEMLSELRGIVGAFQNAHLRTLVEAFLNDHEITRKLKLAPAGKSVHHAFLGGLLEHLLSMCTVAKLLAGHYREVDLDLLLTGVVLHDIGKIDELTYDRSFGYSTQGQLLGHIQIGISMLAEKVRMVPGFPPRLRILVEHMILSHHGESEFGSPKQPLFMEALLLHHIDNMDSKMECMRSFVEKDKLIDGCWTTYVPSLDRSVLKKRKYLEEEDEAKPRTAAAAAPAAPAQPNAFERAASYQRSGSVFAEKLKGALGGGSQ